jgi:hypothetical protein
MYDWMRYISFISPEETHRHPHHHPHLPDLMVHASAFKPSVGVLTPFNPSVGVLTHAMEIQELQAGFASRRTYIHVYIIYTYIYIYTTERQSDIYNLISRVISIHLHVPVLSRDIYSCISIHIHVGYKAAFSAFGYRHRSVVSVLIFNGWHQHYCWKQCWWYWLESCYHRRCWCTADICFRCW